jgi:hypothetical protein
MKVDKAMEWIIRKEFRFTNKAGSEITYKIASVRGNNFYDDMYNVVVRTSFVKLSSSIANHIGKLLINYFGVYVTIVATGNSRDTISYTFSQLK